MNQFQQHCIFVLAPHTDDGELGCGASVAKYIAAGHQVFYIAFSTCSQSLPKNAAANTLTLECKAATAALGIAPDQVIFFDFEVRKLVMHRQEILEQLIRLNKKYNPHTVLLPAKNDIHQDHQVIYAEGIRAFKDCNLLGYELPWNNKEFNPTYFETISEDFVNVKTAALQEYKSQAEKKYMSSLFIHSLAIVRGLQSNTRFAEAFEVYHFTN